MAVTVRRDLVAFGVQPLDPCRIPLCGAAQGKEGAAYAGLIKDRLDTIQLAIERLREGAGIPRHDALDIVVPILEIDAGTMFQGVHFPVASDREVNALKHCASIDLEDWYNDVE